MCWTLRGAKMIPNPLNDYVPRVGDKVRIIGNCHERLLNKIVTITQVYGVFYECTYFDDRIKEVVFTGGELGGLEPIE